MTTLSKKGFDAIKKDSELFGKIAKVLDVSPFTLPDKMRRKDAAFTQHAVIQLIKEATGLTEADLIETIKSKNKTKAVA